MNRGFRVWDKQTKSYEWDREFVLSSSGELMELYSNHNGTWEYHFADTDRFIIEFDTGLKDKNGKKIYEGDIIKTCCGKARVCFDEEYCLYKIWLKHGTTMHLVGKKSHRHLGYEVIGNIHDNSEF